MKKFLTVAFCIALTSFSVFTASAQSNVDEPILLSKYVRNVLVLGNADCIPQKEVNFQLRTILDNEFAFIAGQDNVKLVYNINKNGKLYRSGEVFIKKAGNTSKITVPTSFNKDTTYTLTVSFPTSKIVEKQHCFYVSL